MADRHVETTHQGYFSRLASSLMGVLIGFLLIPGSVVLISWNEYRTIHRTRGLIEAEQVVEEVTDPMEIVPEQNDKLVHVVGPASTDEQLADSEFGIERVALRLAREVEMYQWTEHKETRTREKIGGGTETITTYEYKKSWESNRVDSEQFKQAASHVNPSLRYRTKYVTAQQATLGGYHLTANQVETLSNWQELPIKLNEILVRLPESERSSFTIDGAEGADSGARLYWRGTHADSKDSGVDQTESSSPRRDQPLIGDLRISFRSVEPTTLSALAQQKADYLGGYRTSNGEVVESLEVGQHSAAEMFEMLRSQNAMLAWILRGVGWILACVGFGLITGPLATLGSVIPFLGRLVGMATFAISLLLGSCVAIIAIAIAWLAVRPVMAIALLAIVGLLLYFVLFRRKPAAPYPPPAVLA